MKLSQEELNILENNLSCPKGKIGKQIADTMFKSNFDMIKSSILALHLNKEDYVLELGFGNCNHLKFLLEKAENIKYFGLEVSEIMYKEANKNHTNLSSHSINLRLYDGEKIPFNKHQFNKIFTVNTIYFWKNPKRFINELERVLKPNGIIAITFAQKEFMKSLPFVKDKFRLYSSKYLENIIRESTLFLVDLIDKTENIKSKSGKYVTRKYTTAVLKKIKNV